MKGAIIYSGQYGSTAQYAAWIGEATGLPVFDAKSGAANLAEFDFLVLGSSIIIYKPTLRRWIDHHLIAVCDKPVLFFTVSGAPAGEKLDGWIRNSLPEAFTGHMKHVALRGRLDLRTVGWWTRLILKIGAMFNKDAKASSDEWNGFDYMDKAAIAPIVEWVEQKKREA